MAKSTVTSHLLVLLTFFLSSLAADNNLFAAFAPAAAGNASVFSANGSLILSADVTTVTDCSTGQQCTLGCCSTSSGVCGLGPQFCAPTICNAALSAKGSCAQLSECDPGVFPGFGTQWGTHAAQLLFEMGS
jgi:hypothetical protein